MTRIASFGTSTVVSVLSAAAGLMFGCSQTSSGPSVEGTQRALSGPAPVLAATADSATTVVLAWGDGVGETGYHVERSTDGGGTFTQVASLGADVTSWTDTGRLPLTTYCYRVSAYDGAGSSSSGVQCVLTPKGYEAESLSWTKSSATVSVVNDAAASAGALVSAAVTTVGGYVQFATTTPSTGVYGTKIRYRATPDAGRFVVTVGGVQYGNEVDGYAASSTFREVYLGEVDITAANASRKLRFELTGRNPSSTGNKIQIDAITMVVAQFRYEAESSGAVTSTGDSQSNSSATGASNGTVNVATLSAVGDYVRYNLTVGAPGTYSVSLRIRKGANRGRFRAWLDETVALGSEVDGYAASNTFAVVSLGTATVGLVGAHTVKLKVTGKNASATSYGITVDDIDWRLSTGNGCRLFGDAIPDGTACDDASACTQNDVCQAGACTGTAGVTCSALDQCHAAGTCDPATGQCSNPAKPDGASCDDGNACTGTDTCHAGTCVGENPVECVGDQCHDPGTCDPGTGQCSKPAKPDGTVCNDGNACTQTDSCHGGICTGTNPVTCTASDACHEPGTCDPGTGGCSNPPKPDGTDCNDGDACTPNDSCQEGVCTGRNRVICEAADQCHEVGLCDRNTGVCSNPAKPDGAGCSDGSACTQSDTCQAGMCTGANPVTCTALDQCHAAGTCDPASGQCSNPTVPDGTGCTDGSACTQTDTCQGGLCVGASPVVCTALDQCHQAGACDPGTGQCGAGPAKPDGAGCDDGNVCTQTDVCQAGACAGTPVTCTASDACHEAGTCDQATGQCTNPVKIGACLRGSPKLSAGNASTCAIRTDGSLACWGENGSGETTPPAGTFTQVSVGAGFACGLLADGTPRCWGGYLSQYTPTWAGFVQIAAGGYGACGLQAEGMAECWGGLSLSGYPLTQIATGYDHACGLLVDGNVQCQGRDNQWGEATPPEGPFVQVVAGEWRSCGLRPDGTAVCWGRQATEYPPPTATFDRLAAGGASTCGLTTAGQILCWGSGGAAQTTPPAGAFANVTVGGDRACAARADNSIACWGADWRGPDWNGANTVPVGQFQEVANSGGTGCRRDANGRATCWGLGVAPPAEASFRQIAVGWRGGCGVLADGTGACWCDASDWGCQQPFGNVTQVAMGDRGYASSLCWLGTDGAIACFGIPQAYPPSGVFRQVVVAYEAACALREDGTVACWGYDAGWGLTTPPSGTFRQIAISSGHGCGLRTDGTLACWGYNEYGQATPPAGEFSAVAVNQYAGCAIKTDGTLACWGSYQYGPSFVPPAGPFRQVSGAGMTFCAISSSGQEWCWGQIIRQPLLCAVEADGACIATEPVVCPPADSCHTPGVFDPVTRQCTRSALPDGTACSDGSACTQSDSCQAGVCVGSNPVVCTTEPWDQCRPNVCDPSSGQCVTRTLPDGSACNDSNACTQTDTCQAGYCMGRNPVQCPTSDNPCVYAGMCDPATGQCGPPSTAWDGSICEDGNGCTLNDTCQGGVCIAGNPVVCSGEGDCYQAGTCEPTTGRCSYVAKTEGAGCDDRNPCTESDVCQAGACTGSAVGGTCEAASSAWMSAGYAHTCALRSDRSIACWGQNYFGQSSPPSGTFKQVTAGYLFSCGLRTDGTPVCWGDNSSWQLNVLPGPYAQLASGLEMSCGLTASGQPQCWGRLSNGWPTGTFTQLALGDRFGCGLRSDGSISCWGVNEVWQSSPPPGVGYRKVTAGWRHACAITASGEATCWGELLGSPTPTGQFVDIGAGYAHACGLRENGAVVCWGQAQGSPPPGGFVAISSGNEHDCAIRGDGSMVCWGNNDAGQATVPPL